MDKIRMATEAVDSIEETFGRFPGHRRAHARGKTFKGIFTGSGAAAEWTKAAHFKQGEVAASIRFSHFSPDPTWADAMSPVKGMGVQLGGREEKLNIVGVTSPVFFASTPESFMEMLEVTRSVSKGRPNLQALIALLKDFPESRAMLEAVKKFQAPAGFSAGLYHSIHAYYFVDAGKRQPIKYMWEPVDGVKGLSAMELAALPIGFYEAQIEDRLAVSPVHFRLLAVLGDPDDPTDDPTKEWPSDRETVVLGELTILEEDPAVDALLFDPTVVATGIECSEDPVLHFRSPAYRASFERRSAEAGEQ